MVGAEGVVEHQGVHAQRRNLVGAGDGAPAVKAVGQGAEVEQVLLASWSLRATTSRVNWCRTCTESPVSTLTVMSGRADRSIQREDPGDPIDGMTSMPSMMLTSAEAVKKGVCRIDWWPSLGRSASGALIRKVWCRTAGYA